MQTEQWDWRPSQPFRHPGAPAATTNRARQSTMILQLEVLGTADVYFLYIAIEISC